MVFARKIVALSALLLNLAVAVAESKSKTTHTYHRGRRLAQTVECFLHKVNIQYLDQTDDDRWECELQGADAASSGRILVDVEGLDFGDFDGDGAEAITLLAEGAVIQDGKLKIPKGSTQHFKKEGGRRGSSAGGRANGAAKGDAQQNRQLAPVAGTRKVLAVRVSAKDATTTSSTTEISNKIFGTSGDTSNLKERMETCSYGQVMIEPFSGTVNGKSITDGVYQVKISSKVKDQPDADVRNAVLSKLQSDFGMQDLTSTFDHVMLCLPAGTTGGWIAYGYLNWYLTVYNNEWCNYPSGQVHEIGHNLGLHHAGEGGVEYADQTGLMGYSYGQDTTRMCYNPAKSWQLGWYPSRSLSLDLANQGPFTGDLIGIVDYQITGAAGKYVTVQVVPVVPGAIPIYVGFNRQAGFNIDTQEGRNQVTVTSQPANHKSQLLAKLSSGGQLTLNNFWYSAPLIIQVNSISTAGSPSMANVNIYLNGCSSNADCSDGDACLVGTCGPFGTCSYSWVGTSCPGNFIMDLTTDDWPGETSWKVQDMCDGGRTVESGGPYGSKSTRYTRSTTLGQSWFRVTVSDSDGDGLGGSPNGSFEATFDGLAVAVGTGNFGFQIVGEFGTPCPTPAPLTPAPVTPAPVTPAPVTPAPVTPAPETPAPVTPAPVTPAPVTPAPVTPAPVTPAPVTPAPESPAPVTPAPVTSAPITPAPVTQAPVTPAPVTPAPVTPAPVTPAPVTPAPVTPAPVAATWQTIFTDDFEAGFTIFQSADNKKCKISTGKYQGTNSLEVKDGKSTSYAYTASSHDVSAFTKVRASFYYYTENVDANEKFYIEWSSNNADWVPAGIFNFGTPPFTQNKVWQPATVEWDLGGATALNLRLRSAFSEGKEKVLFDEFRLEGWP